MKALTFVLIIFSSANTYASTLTQSLEKYCRVSYENKIMSEYAMANDGFYIDQSAYKEEKSLRDYKGCRYDTAWIKDLHGILCNGSQVNPLETIQANITHLNTPKIILFFFDGASDFNASKAYESLKPVNINGTEGNDLNGNGNGLNMLTLFLSSQEVPVKKFKNDIEIHYHSGSGLKQRENYEAAATCALETKYYLDVFNQVTTGPRAEPKWLAIGYSNGGALTLDFQNELPLDLAITIDPIVQADKYVFHKLKKTIGKKSLTTKRLVNLYQTTDKDTLYGFHLRGKPVVDADVNYELTSKNSFLSSTGSLNHVNIIMDPFITNSVVCEFGNLMGETNTCFTK